jgi:hypothetical protein
MVSVVEDRYVIALSIQTLYLAVRVIVILLVEDWKTIAVVYNRNMRPEVK